MKSNDEPRRILWNDRIGLYLEPLTGKPKKTLVPTEGGWCVWRLWYEAYAVEILNEGEFAQFLSQHPEGKFSIVFDNYSRAEIKSGDPLWEVMVKIADEYKIEVFPIGEYLGKYEFLTWTGKDGNQERFFDEIRISAK